MSEKQLAGIARERRPGELTGAEARAKYSTEIPGAMLDYYARLGRFPSRRVRAEGLPPNGVRFIEFEALSQFMETYRAYAGFKRTA